MKKLYFITLATLFIISCGHASCSPVEEMPVSYKGRFRPFEAYARLWLYDLYQKESIKNSHLQSFGLKDNAADQFLWKIHLLGHSQWDDAPLFRVGSARLKSLLGLPLEQDRFSYNELNPLLTHSSHVNKKLLWELIPYYFFENRNNTANGMQPDKVEIPQVIPGLWVSLYNNQITVAAVPNEEPWNTLDPGTLVTANANPGKYHSNAQKKVAQEIQELTHAIIQYQNLTGTAPAADAPFIEAVKRYNEQSMRPEEISVRLETEYPLSRRLEQAGQDILALPGSLSPGKWYSLRALNVVVYDPQKNALVPVPNFTEYPDAVFAEVRSLYKKLELSTRSGDNEASAQLTRKIASLLLESYMQLAGNPYLPVHSKTLYYPGALQLKAEAAYYNLPLIGIAIGLYALAAAALLFNLSQKKPWLFNSGAALLGAAFLVHTIVLALRCYILGRPPVSNMFETVVYVPWVSVLISFGILYFFRSELIFIASSIVAMTLLILLKVANLDSNLENVQAVLDSQFWLIIHVLMVVGSYGMFILSGVLGHLYLALAMRHRKPSAQMQAIGKMVLHSMYAGCALLIPGTILGGVWAAESWGRFWDWDPKESWAFISSCVYLMWIHAHRFRHIGDYGLAIGSIVGLMVISFTWYGVNYILGTGLHSYGFGSGGEVYYYLFLAAEAAFIACAAWQARRRLEV